MNNKDSVNNHTHNIIEKYTGTRVSQQKPQGQGEAQPISDRETCPRGCEGAGAATSARDISVGEMISDHSPYRNVHHQIVKLKIK